MTPSDSQTKIKVTLSPIEQPKSLSPADVSAIAQQIIANVEKVVVDESTIEENKPPLHVYREAAKKA